MAKLVRLNHLKTLLKILSVGQQRLALIIRAVLSTPIINFRRSRKLDDENVAVIAQLITLYQNKHSNSLHFS
jgi:ABC-type molybdenum transport system ATPase subunit/photorepair protein PhrA